MPFSNCGICAFFAPADEKITGAKGWGVCRWRPPIAIPMQVQGKASPANPQGVMLAAQALRPPVQEGDGCGQWEGKSAAN